MKESLCWLHVVQGTFLWWRCCFWQTGFHCCKDVFWWLVDGHFTLFGRQLIFFFKDTATHLVDGNIQQGRFSNQPPLPPHHHHHHMICPNGIFAIEIGGGRKVKCIFWLVLAEIPLNESSWGRDICCHLGGSQVSFLLSFHLDRRIWCERERGYQLPGGGDGANLNKENFGRNFENLSIILPSILRNRPWRFLAILRKVRFPPVNAQRFFSVLHPDSWNVFFSFQITR